MATVRKVIWGEIGRHKNGNFMFARQLIWADDWDQWAVEKGPGYMFCKHEFMREVPKTGLRPGQKRLCTITIEVG